jgi:ATP-dependent Clp protease ATP-binding subunit ClpA
LFESLTGDARAVVQVAKESARQLGHNYVGTGHLLLALVGTDEPAGAVLRERGVTPELVKEQIVRRVGLGAGAGLFAGLDEKALAAIGIDLDAVQATIQASFSDAALYRAAQSVYAQQRRRSRSWRGWRVWGPARRRSVEPAPASVDASGRYVPLDRRWVPFTPRTKLVIERSLREAVALHDAHVGVQHLALAILNTDGGSVSFILAGLHAHPGSLRAAILNRYRRAG